MLGVPIILFKEPNLVVSTVPTLLSVIVAEAQLSTLAEGKRLVFNVCIVGL
jgi:hypothetical protein